MKKIILSGLLAAILALGVSRTQSQSMGSTYTTAIGVKFYPGSFTLKHFIGE